MGPLLAPLIGGGISAGLSLLGGSKKSKAKPLITPQQSAAQSKLLDLMNRVQDYPTQGVAGLSDRELLAGQGIEDYYRSEPEGADYYRGLLSESGNIMDNPEYKAILDKVFERGALETNRVGRSLQLRGAAGGSAGRDILGRSVEDTQTAALSALAPYAESERNRRMQAAGALASLSEQSTLRRLTALSEQGALERQLEQLRQNADYARQMQELNFPYETQARMASSVLGAPVDWQITGGEPSILQQLSPALSQFGGALMNMGSKGA